MYVLRQMVEKRLEVQGGMDMGFVDLEKAFDTVPREMVMYTLLLSPHDFSCKHSYGLLEFFSNTFTDTFMFSSVRTFAVSC